MSFLEVLNDIRPDERLVDFLQFSGVVRYWFVALHQELEAIEGTRIAVLDHVQLFDPEIDFPFDFFFFAAPTHRLGVPRQLFVTLTNIVNDDRQELEVIGQAVLLSCYLNVLYFFSLEFAYVDAWHPPVFLCRFLINLLDNRLIAVAALDIEHRNVVHQCCKVIISMHHEDP